MIVIVDINIGNLGSIKNMLKKAGTSAIVSSKIDDIVNAEKLILPGVGSFDNAVYHMKKLGIDSVLNLQVLKKKIPILGICLGMQLMTKGSEEGKEPGLGWINARTVKFSFKEQKKIKIPHMGWNSVQMKKLSKFFKDLKEYRFYFVHSYYVICEEENDILCTTDHGFSFTSGIERENILGVQFHPEKSHKFGMQVIKNFVEKY